MIRPLYSAREPFVKSESGFGYMGVVEYDEKEDKVRCHECGEFFEYLWPHLRLVHRVGIDAHRIKYGLNFNQPLCGIKLSEQRRLQMTEKIQRIGHKALKRRFKRSRKQAAPRHIGTATEAQKNKNGLCDLQMKTRYKIIEEDLGHQPTTQELRKIDHALLSAIERRYKTLNNFRALVGGQPMTAQDYQTKTEAEIVDSLVRWKKENGRTPVTRDFQKAINGYPQITTIYGHFGSLKNALSLAGL